MAKKDKAPLSEEAQAAEDVKTASLTEALHDYDTYVQAQAASIWQYDEIPVPLNLEEQLFVRSYIIDRNEVAAMRRLGHSIDDHTKLKARAKKYLAKVEVQEAIDFLAKRMMEKLDITAEKVNRQIASVAFFDPREVMSFDQYGVRLIHSRFWSAEQAAVIQSIKMGQNGIEIKLYDRLRATEMLAKQLKLQPEDNDPAEAAKAGAEAALEKIFSVFNRTVKDDEPEQEPKRLN